MKEIQCLNCGALFTVEGTIPDFICTCENTKFIELNN